MRASRRSAAERLRVGWLLTGAAGLRRAYHDSERLGARGSAWPCVSALRRPGRRPVYSARFITDWRRGGPRGSCQGILGWVNGFATRRKRLVQANACSGRPPRAPAMGRAAGGPAHHGRSCGRSREGVPPRRNSLAIGALFTRGVHCATGFAPWWVLNSSLTLCAARDQRVPAGKSGRSLRLGAPPLLLFEGAARCRRRKRLTTHRVGACATPTPLTLRTHVLQPGASARFTSLWFPLVGAEVGAARASLGRWRCGFLALLSGRALCAARGGAWGSAGYLVDPASSHMLVSKIKPCMSQYKCFTAKLRMAH